MRKNMAMIGVLVCTMLLMTACGGSKFAKVCNEVVEEYSEISSGITLAEDGSYLMVDTNPINLDDYNWWAVYDAVEDINRKMGFPDSLMVKIGNTTALNGVQTHTTDGITATWSYHPNKGLEIMYEQNEK